MEKQGTEIAIREDKAVALYELETRFALAVRQRELLENYIKERLKPDKHFYTVGDDPGRKPSLTKEGAELICLPHALKGHYEWLFGPENPPLDNTPYQISMKCELEANGKFAGDGIGSASSHITTKAGEHKPRQKDPGLRHNATLKMACKSAYIAAILNSTAASEFFTQDLEDDQTGSAIKQETEDKGHWCANHQTPFFMKGKMKSFAHPIGNTGQWCHESKEPLEAQKTARVVEKDIDELWGQGKSKVPVEGREVDQTTGEITAEKSEAQPAAEVPPNVAQRVLHPEKEQPSPTPQETETSLIDLAWLKQSLNELNWTGVLKWLQDKYQVTGRRVSEVVLKLTPDQQKEFFAEVKSRLQLK